VKKYHADAPEACDKITLANPLGHPSGISNFANEKAFSA
jgi:hypothetical protein